MEALVPFLSNLLAGAVGGNAAGALLKKINLGMMGNTLAGLVGGALSGQMLEAVAGGAIGGANAVGIIVELLVGGAGGALFTVAIGFIRRYVGTPDE